MPASGGFREVPVYDRYLLASGTKLTGPAIIEERESTVIVNGEANILVAPDGSLVAALRESES